jgi:hypothetical protein
MTQTMPPLLAATMLKSENDAADNAVMPPRRIHAIARDIATHWAKPHFGAKPYLVAMFALTDIDSNYGFDDARSIIAYFLGNAKTWRGPDAVRIKAELNAMLKGPK